MQYQGGKNLNGDRIAQEIYVATKHRYAVEPFCGSAAITVRLARFGFDVAASDCCAPLISLLSAVKDGWDPPGQLSESEYQAARHLPDTDPRKAFAGFGCSFGAKWFGGYARGKNYASVCRRSLLKKRSHFRCVAFSCRSFFDIEPRGGVALYCDPPYAGTLSYGAVGDFDNAAFWVRCREWSAVGADVFVSEYTAPDWVPLLTSFDRAKGLGDGRATEKLFILRGASASATA